MTDLAEQLSGAWNFRDVTSTTRGLIRPGRLFRAGELSHLDDTGRHQMTQLGITDVADLRSPPEVRSHGPGLVPDGVVIHLLPFVEDVLPDGEEAPHEHAFARLMTEKPDDESTSDAAARYMTEEYGRIALAPLARRAVHRMVSLLGDERSLLVHCFAGKDRTGFTVAVVLEAAGLDRDAIMADYLASNAAAPELRTQIMERIKARFDGELPSETADFTEARLSDDVLGVREDYLASALRSVEEEFGSVTGYLRAADVTDDDLTRLRVALLG